MFHYTCCTKIQIIKRFNSISMTCHKPFTSFRFLFLRQSVCLRLHLHQDASVRTTLPKLPHSTASVLCVYRVLIVGENDRRGKDECEIISIYLIRWNISEQHSKHNRSTMQIINAGSRMNSSRQGNEAWHLNSHKQTNTPPHVSQQKHLFHILQYHQHG